MRIVVALALQAPGLCPSCTARRMADTAAHLVDHVLPRAPYRQWVFTVPKALRLRLARDPAWTTWVGNLAVRAIRGMAVPDRSPARHPRTADRGDHIRAAVRQLSNMLYTCSLDVVRDYPDGLAESSVAMLLGVTEQAINQEIKAALIKFRAGLRKLAIESDDI